MVVVARWSFMKLSSQMCWKVVHFWRLWMHARDCWSIQIRCSKKWSGAWQQQNAQITFAPFVTQMWCKECVKLVIYRWKTVFKTHSSRFKPLPLCTCVCARKSIQEKYIHVRKHSTSVQISLQEFTYWSADVQNSSVTSHFLMQVCECVLHNIHCSNSSKTCVCVS